MKIIQATLNFAGEIHTIYVQVEDSRWNEPAFRIKLKNRLECNPTVLRLRESEEPNWKKLAQDAQAEVKALGKQLSDALKKLNEAQIDQKAAFRIFQP